MPVTKTSHSRLKTAFTIKSVWEGKMLTAKLVRDGGEQVNDGVIQSAYAHWCGKDKRIPASSVPTNAGFVAGRNL